MVKVTVHQETPTESVVKAANQTTVVKDTKGRTIGIKKMGPLDRLRLFELIGAENSRNEAYVGYAALAYLVVSINGEELPRPTTKAHLEARVQQLDEDGMDAIGQHFADQVAATEQEGKEALKNA